MEQTTKEYQGLLCNIYIVFLLVVLPLYTGGTYYKIGDTKYQLFHDVTLVCLGIWLLLEVFIIVSELIQNPRKKAFFPVLGEGWSFVDCFVTVYGLVSLSSAYLSRYETAWVGENDWYMGAVSQLLFVGIYFFVSRSAAMNRMVMYLVEAGFLIVIIVGILNKLEIDPLNMFAGFTEMDWEFSHMLSTIGNINWLCGYCSVMLAFPVAGYLHGKEKWREILCFGISVLGMLLLCIQGSDSGWLIVMAALGLCLIIGVKKKEFFHKALVMALGVVCLIPIMGQLVTMLEAQQAIPVDGDMYAKMLRNEWWFVAAFLLTIIIFHKKLHGRAGKVLRMSILGALVVLAMAVLLIKGVGLSGVSMAQWGSGRGALWSMALQAFGKADFMNKLFGVGPDCFGQYCADIGLNTMIMDEGYWANSVFVNAHNEWLNHLVNIGLLGMLAYMGIFLCGLKRYRGMMLGLLVLAMYGVNSFFSFQQVMNTPLLFLVLGICESRCRVYEQKREKTVVLDN